MDYNSKEIIHNQKANLVTRSPPTRLCKFYAREKKQTKEQENNSLGMILCHKQNNALEMKNDIKNAKENFTQLKISGNSTDKSLNLQQLIFIVAS